MTPDNIDTKALRELEAKATPGPWHPEPIYYALRMAEKGGCGHVSDDLPDDALYPTYRDGHDVALIVALRNAAPALLATVEAQRKENERLLRDHAPHYCAIDHAPIRHWESTDPEELACPACHACNAHDNVEAERDALKAEIEAQRKEIEELRAEVGSLDLIVNAADARANSFEAERNALDAEVERLRQLLRKSKATAGRQLWGEIDAALRGEEAPR